MFNAIFCPLIVLRDYIKRKGMYQLLNNLKIKFDIIPYMRIFIKCFFILFIVFLSAVSSQAFLSDQDIGTTTAQFLKLGIGAKNAGMGNASVSNVCGSDAIYWNPANLYFLDKKTLSFSHTVWFEDISYEWIALAIPTQKNGTFGVGLQYVSYGSIARVNSSAVSDGSFSPMDMAVYLSYATSYKHFQFGGNLKYINSKIENSATAFAVDFGTNWNLPDNKTSVAMAISNFGTTMKFNNESEKLPLLLKTGISSYVLQDLLVSLDINFPNDNNLYFNLGSEYGVNISDKSGLFFRAGYDGRNKDIPGFNWLNLGFGISYSDITFDYAFVPYGDIGMTHMFSFSMKFGEVINK